MDLQKAINDAPAGATVRVPAGAWPVQLVIDKAVTLVGEPGAVLDGGGRGPVVRIAAPRANVRLEKLTLRNGNAEAGGAVAFQEAKKLELVDCTFERNAAPAYGGGGAFLAGESAELHRCRFVGNTGRQGAGLLVDQTCQLVVRDCLFAENVALTGGGAKVKEGAKALFIGCTFADNRVVGEKSTGASLDMAGTMSRKPSVQLVNCIVAGRDPAAANDLSNDSPNPATLSVKNTLLPEAMKGNAKVAGPGVRFGSPGFVRSAPEPYVPGPESPAVGCGEPSVYDETSRDLRGKPRLRDGKADLGALAAG